MQQSIKPQQLLPIYKYKSVILDQVARQSVIIISGLTGCGKSTQVSQYLLDSYTNAKIAVCEPRRLAATTLALRVCQERQTKISTEVGYQIGLECKRSENTRLTYMTYGILIQQLLFKDELNYDFIILDEVHERSLEMDFAFVILKKIINQNISKKLKSPHDVIKKSSEKVQEYQNQVDQIQKIKQTKQSKEQEKSTQKLAINKNIKLIIMSATLNSEQFQKYFAVHKTTSLIIQPEVVIKYQIYEKNNKRGTRENQYSRGNRYSHPESFSKKQVQFNYLNIDEYRNGSCIIINEKNPYIVNQEYLDDFLTELKQQVPQINYQNKEDVRLNERHYDWGCKLIVKSYKDLEKVNENTQLKSNASVQSADILVFLPGLSQITSMKERLARQDKNYIQKIVEVHSLFSEELYNKLFKSKIKNKIILATNIGQSSITLPNCKVVIDYCLNRKAIKNSKDGISRFTTTVASLSNLIQRKGRVGRVSNGTVYRMITKAEFKKLDEFDIPQIKQVSLDMSILRTKKLQSTSKRHLFEDIYDIFLNVIQPPQINAIQTAIDSLIREEALQYVEDSVQEKLNTNASTSENRQKINYGKKYEPKKLKITKVGQFMVSMPCQLSISKLILMGIKIGISSIIVDIAAIILSTKSFFCHQQRRYNIEQFMHSMIGYDNGDNNDYLLRQRLFDHWRSKFFIPFRDRYKTNQSKSQPKLFLQQNSIRMFDIKDQVIEFDQNYKIVENFARKRECQEELHFCKIRGVYCNHMRELLRVSETLKIRLEEIGVQKQKLKGFKAEAQLVLICLMYAFPDVICKVTFDAKQKSKSNFLENRANRFNQVCISLAKGLTERQFQHQLLKYLQPQKQYNIEKLNDSFIIQTSDHVLKKFYLPKYYSKASTGNCSILYKHCKDQRLKYPYEFNVINGFSNLLVLNESINKEILICIEENSQNKIEDKYLISNNLIESKDKYMMGANALLTHFQLVVISMIVKKDIKLRIHPSQQFFSHIEINNEKFQIPLLLTEHQLTIVNSLRQLSKRKKQYDISSYKEQFIKQQLKTLSNLFQLNNLKNFEEDWEQIFIEQQQKKLNAKKSEKKRARQHEFCREQCQNWIPIQCASGKIKPPKANGYFERYNQWKQHLLEATQKEFKLYSTVESILVCGHCLRNDRIVEVASCHSYDFNSKSLKLNRYSGSWICPQSKNEEIGWPGFKILCIHHHHIGTSIDSDFAEIDLTNIYLYVPFNEYHELKKIDSPEIYHEIQRKIKKQGLQNLKNQHERIEKWECKICYSKETQKITLSRSEVRVKKDKRNKNVQDPLWDTIINHIFSNNHMSAKQKLKNSIFWN